MKLKAILILLAVLAVAGTTYYFVSRPKATKPPTANYYVWDFDMDKLQKVTISLPKLGESESFIRHTDQEFYFDVENGPEVDNQRWGGGIPVLLSGPMASRLITLNATSDQLKEYGFDPTTTKLNMDALLTITLNGSDVVYDVQVGDSNPEGTTYYVKLSNLNDVYTVDKSWYDVLADIISNPPYIPATLAIGTPTVSSTTVAVGGTETVSVIITNNGDVKGSFNINLLINSDLQDTQTITLDPRGSQTVDFTVIENVAGKYVASINQQHNVTFTVQ